jgi:hypothetical protein
MKWRRTLRIRRLAVAFGVFGLMVAATAQARPDATLGPGSEQAQSSFVDKSAASYYTPQALKAEGARWTAMAKALGGMPAASYYTLQALKSDGLRLQGQAEAYAGVTSSPAVRPDDRAGIHSVDGLALYDTQDRIFAIADPEELVRNEPGYAPASPTTAQPVQPVLSVRPDNRPGTHGVGPTVEPVPVSGGGFDWADWSIGIGSGFGATLLAAAAMMLFRRKQTQVTGRVATSAS